MLDFTYKEILWAIAAFLVVPWHYYYIKSILQGDTKPHIYTNIIWVILMGIGFILQIKNGGGPGAWMLGLTATSNVFILFLAFKYWTKDITKFDRILFIWALLCIPIYLFVDNKLYSLLLVILIDILWYIPTLRKTLKAPFSENLSAWNIWTLKIIISIPALIQYNIFTLFYPIIMILVNMTLIIGMIYQRKKYPNLK